MFLGSLQSIEMNFDGWLKRSIKMHQRLIGGDFIYIN